MGTRCIGRNFGIAPERVSLLGEFDPQQRGLEIHDPFSYSSAVDEECYGHFATVSLTTLPQLTS